MPNEFTSNGAGMDSTTDSGKATITRYVLLGWLCLAATVAYICRNSIGVAESTIRKELGLSEDAMAWVMSSFFLTYALGQIPTGWFANAVGSRKAIPLFSVVWSLATGLMGFAHGVGGLLTTRLVNGMAQAGLFPSSTNTIARWFPSSHRAFASGSLASCMSIGGAVGVAITGSLVVTIGWRQTFGMYSILGVLWAMGFFWWFREFPSQHPGVNAQELDLIQKSQPHSQAKHQDPTPWLEIYLSPALWWICGQQFCRAAGQIFFASWFATYLQETRAVSVKTSGFLNSLPLLGIVIGSFLGGAISDYVLARSGSRRLARTGVSISSMLSCAVFVFAAYFISDPVLAVIVISLGSFCSAAAGPCGYSVTIDVGGRHVAVVFATMNMVGNLGAFAFIIIVPRMIAWTNSWDGVLVLFGLLHIVAAGFWLLIYPDRPICENHKNNNG